VTALTLLTATQWVIVALIFVIVLLLVSALTIDKAEKRARRRQGNWDAYRDELRHRDGR
jgi:membrane protein YdbS with pleckstrin-like domain